MQSLQRSSLDPEKINGFHATFESAKNDPVHCWYPYLEGYSASFVESLRRRFMPLAQRIIDPFAGTGTTPLALATVGVQCGYCEANPAMRFVVQTKLKAVNGSSHRRSTLATRFLKLADSLEKKLVRSSPDKLLHQSYADCFASSVFFEPGTLETVLRLRTLCDEVMKENDLLGRLLTLATVANLVSCSLLKRAGDVRFKTKEELARGIPDPIQSIGNLLRKMCRHVKHFPSVTAQSVLLANDAKTLQSAPPFKAQGVITSPPYLNGTNYIRNTKLELWFLRAIHSRADLRTLRDEVITSGINDVTVATQGTSSINAVAKVVRRIEAAAYDERIHRMVAGYFADMQLVLQGLWLQTEKDATLCIDIGDSRYAGVNVPTQDLLIEVAETVGFHFLERLPLRTRVSKDGSHLSQDILVFRRLDQLANLKEADKNNFPVSNLSPSPARGEGKKREVVFSRFLKPVRQEAGKSAGSGSGTTFHTNKILSPGATGGTLFIRPVLTREK